MTAQWRPLGPDATIGILGGGQLGRMLVLAAARLGFRCHVLCPDAHSPAFDVVRSVTEADYLDMAALDRFAADVDVVTYEFENVPAETATFLSARKPVLPDPRVLATTQDRLIEKEFVRGLGIEALHLGEQNGEFGRDIPGRLGSARFRFVANRTRGGRAGARRYCPRPDRARLHGP